MFCRQNSCWHQHFLVKIVQNLVKIGPVSNCYIYAINQGNNEIDPSLESTEIALYIYNNILYHSNYFADISTFWRVNYIFMTMS